MQRAKTMEDFWIEMGWHKEVYDRDSGRRVRKLVRGKWKDDEQAQQDAIRFLVDEVLQKDPRDVTQEDFHGNRLWGAFDSSLQKQPL